MNKFILKIISKDVRVVFGKGSYSKRYYEL